MKIIRSVCCLLLLLLMASVLTYGRIAAESEPSDWFKDTPVIHTKIQLKPNEAVPYSINGNQDCIKQKVVTKPRRMVPVWPYVFPEESHESCVVNTRFGAISQSGYLQVTGETTFGKVYFPNGSKEMTLLAIPRSEHVMYLEAGTLHGVGLVMIENFLQHIDGLTLPNGQIRYTVKSDTKITRLVNAAGERLGVYLDSVSFSPDGRWMVGDIHLLGLSRIDLRLFIFDVKTFDVGFDYSKGVTPGLQSAVTSSGRYSVVSSGSFTRVRLYDLDDCAGARCKFLDLQSFFTNRLPGYITMANLRFSSDYSLKLYAAHQPPGEARKIQRMILRAPGHDVPSFDYLGLGDSFASGEGAYQYKAATDVDANKCHVSLRSYAYLIAEQLALNQAESVACTGAKIRDIRDTSIEYNGDSQAKGKEDSTYREEIIKNFLPGYRAQINFTKEYLPEVTTVSIVGNDVGFKGKILRCLMPDTCFNGYEDRVELVREINGQFDRLVDTYTELKKETDYKKIYVIGYPEMAMDGGSCGNNVGLNPEEVKFSNQLIGYLNSVVRAAADKSGVFYVDVEKAMYGSRLCEPISGEKAFHGITKGDDIVNLPFTEFGGPIGNESFHPTALGHRLYKKEILAQTNNFTVGMPAPNPHTPNPTESDELELIKAKPKTHRPIRFVRSNDDMVPDKIFRNEPISGSVEQLDSGFAPGSRVELWLHSDPIKLAELTADTSGDVGFEFSVGDEVAYGFHTLHLYGTGITGKPLDIQKVVYVADASMHAPAPGTDPQPEGPDLSDDSNNPKPPENNPETVAGDEQILLTLSDRQPVSENTGADPLYNQGPYQVPDRQRSEETPQVAGANTQSVSQTQAVGETPGQEETGWPTLLLPVSLFAGAVLLIGGRLLKKR